MERKKHKRLNDTIMKPEDLKKSRIQKVGGVSGPSTSGTSGGIKAKLDFRSTAPTVSKPNMPMNSTVPGGNPLQSSHTVRPVLDDSWKEFGDLMIFNVDTFEKSIEEAVKVENFTKIAKMFVAALKSFLANDKLKVEYRVIGTIANVAKLYGSKLNHVPLHRALLFIISHSRSYPDNVLQLFVSIVTSLAKQQPLLDKCYIAAYLHDVIGMNFGLGTVNRCWWTEKPYSEELVKLIMSPFGTSFPTIEMYTSCQVENFTIADYFPKTKLAETPNEKQLEIYLEFLKPWFETIRGEVLPRPLFRALCLLCGYDQVRWFIASRLEVWITLQKFHREISEILLVIGCNINTAKPLDKEVIDTLLKLNTKSMKTRTITGPFTVAIKRICESPVNVLTVMEALFINETGSPQNRSPTNLMTMYMLLTCQPVETTKALAVICSSELFREREISAKMLRSFLRELIRGFHHSKSEDFQFSVFAESMLYILLERGESGEIVHLATELISQIPLASISSLVASRENLFAAKFVTPTTSGDLPLIPPEVRLAREKFQSEFILYCEIVIEWLSKSRHLFSDEIQFIQCYSLLLFLERQKDIYTGIEMAAVNDAELTNSLRIFGECGISEKMFLLLFKEEDNVLPPKTIVELVSVLTQRAALCHLKYTGAPLVKISEPFKLIDAFLAITIIPQNEVPRFDGLPVLCYRNLYWTAWNTITLWVAAGEIIPFFHKIYDTSPILRYLIFCILTKRFVFPLDFDGMSSMMLVETEASDVAHENQIRSMYEKRMQRSPPANAFLFPTRKEFRAPSLLDDVRIFSERFNLASTLSRCNNPPLLSCLVSQVGAEKSLFAIREMLEADSHAAASLSSECIFHALLYYFDNQRINDNHQNTKTAVRSLIYEAEMNLKSTEPVEKDILLNSFVTSLASPNISTRTATVNTLTKLFPAIGEEEFDLSKFAKVPRFESSKLKYLEIIASAILIESNSQLANSYLRFLTSNSLQNAQDHTLACAVSQVLSVDCIPLYSSLCHYFVQYVERCAMNHTVKEDLKSMSDNLCCIDFGPYRISLSKEVPIAVVKLLSKYSSRATNGMRDAAFESLIDVWLSPGSIPREIDRDTGASRQFLSLSMKKEMLKSSEQRIVDAALDELSEEDAQEFILVSQMSQRTAEKVISKAENMKVEGIDRQTLSNMYLLIRGYHMRGVKAGGNLVARLKNEIDRPDSFVAKEEEMDITEYGEYALQGPSNFLEEDVGEGVFSNLEIDNMPTADITTWLKNNCHQTPTKQKDAPSFRLPPSFIQSVMNDEKSSLSCLQHIEANLKFFLSHEPAFQTLMVIIDSSANKFEFVRKRMENLAVRLLKSVSPPETVSGILKKHAANNRAGQETSKEGFAKGSTFAEFAVAVKKGISNAREADLVDSFLSSFVEDKGEVIEPNDVLVFIKSLRSVYDGGNPETTAERCMSNRWNTQLHRAVCSTVLEKYYNQICPVFVFFLVSAYCRKFPMASYCELFTIRNSCDCYVLNGKSIQTAVVYFSEVASKNSEYDSRIINLIAALESQGKTQVGFHFGRALLQTSCANSKPEIRRTANRLLEGLADRLPYISYKRGVASSIRVLTNVESRESCIRRCEQIIDRIVEMPLDPKMALAEDICEEERQSKDSSKNDDDQKGYNGSKRFQDRARSNGPPAKKGRYISAKDLPIPLLSGSQQQQQNQPTEEVSGEAPKREWIATSHAMTRFVSLLREHPNIVKMKFPVLANFIPKVSLMSRNELKEENRVQKIELILEAVISLCPIMKPEETSSVDTALSNCIEFYEKHVDDGGLGIKEQTSFAELFVKACAEYLNSSFVEARSFLRDNRPSVERMCKRCQDRHNADLVLENCEPSPV